MAFKRIAVVGAGTMGNGIAQVAAMNGIEVSLRDTEDRFLQRAVDSMRTSLGRFAKKGAIDEAGVEAALGRIKPTTDLAEAVRGAEVVIEAVPELLDLKKEVFKELDRVAEPSTVLATNTSQLSITSIAAATSRPEKVIGMHFFNPPVMMKLIEIIRGLDTSDETLQAALELSEQMRKETVVCQKDTQGFITSRAILALRLECIRIYEEGIASMADIDKAMRLGFNHPMGPFELNDFNGLDTGFFAASAMREMYGERFLPPQSLANKVKAGHLGRKTGRGWYDYRKPESK